MARSHGAQANILELLEQVRAERPTDACLLSENSAWTYDDVSRKASHLAGALISAGVERHERVAILLCSSPVFVLTYLAVARTGAIPVPLDPMASPRTVALILADCSPCAIICEADTAAGLATLPISSVRACFVQRAEARTSDMWDLRIWDLSQALRHDETSRVLPSTDPNDVAAIVYTSGTTDVPKGVMLTHSNVAALVRTGVETIGVGREDRIGHILPLFHLYGLREMQIAIAAGATLVMSTQTAFPASLLKWFESNRVTGFPGVPGHFSLFLGRYRELFVSLGQHLRYILLGTAHTPSSLLENLRLALPRTRIYKTYGLTECGRVTTGDFTDPVTPASSVGPPAPGVEVTVRDEAGRPLQRGKIGRIFISSEMVMKGYWRRTADNAEVLTGQCFKTRDLGYIDELGQLFLVARADEMINTGGEKTAPWEVELVLLQHPSIAKAAVVAVEDDEGVLGQVPKAFVVPREGITLEAKEVIKHCARHLEPYKVPRKIVFLSRLPETALGKVQLHALKHLD